MSRQQQRTLIKRGELVAVRYGVYATASYVAKASKDPRSWHALQAAAAMLSSPTRPVVASHESAARIHGLDLLNAPPEERVTLTRLPRSATGHLRGTRFVAAMFGREDITKCFVVVPVTTAARTVVDLARTLPFMDGVVVADSALRLRMVTKAELTAVVDRCAQWRGAERARRVVEFGDGLAESVLESCARVVFDRNGLEPPELQVHFDTAGGEYRSDFYWRKYWTIAEADGLQKYADKAMALNQLRRDQFLRETGRHVVHFTWRELFYQEAVTIGRLTATFATPPPPARDWV
ncbi:MAG TPA: hypothetical protein VF060_14925 [Trebonia sp.]